MLYVCEHFYLITVIIITCLLTNHCASLLWAKGTQWQATFVSGPNSLFKGIRNHFFPQAHALQEVKRWSIVSSMSENEWIPISLSNTNAVKNPPDHHLAAIRCDCRIPFIQASTVATELALQEVLFRAQDPCLPLERRDSLGGNLLCSVS